MLATAIPLCVAAAAAAPILLSRHLDLPHQAKLRRLLLVLENRISRQRRRSRKIRCQCCCCSKCFFVFIATSRHRRRRTNHNTHRPTYMYAYALSTTAVAVYLLLLQVAGVSCISIGRQQSPYTCIHRYAYLHKYLYLPLSSDSSELYNYTKSSNLPIVIY